MIMMMIVMIMMMMMMMMIMIMVMIMMFDGDDDDDDNFPCGVGSWGQNWFLASLLRGQDCRMCHGICWVVSSEQSGVCVCVTGQGATN